MHITSSKYGNETIMQEEKNKISTIFKDLNTVKAIVQIFKQGNWNELLLRGFKLIQEVEKRFGSYFAVVERFLKSIDKACSIIGNKGSHPATEALMFLDSICNDQESTTYLSLEAIKNCFGPVCYASKQLERTNVCTIYLALSMLKKGKHQLTLISRGTVNTGTYIATSDVVGVLLKVYFKS